MIIKVKEPQPDEVNLIKDNQIVFTFFHFAADRELTEGIINSGSTAIAYETIEGSDGSLPILIPMSVRRRSVVTRANLYPLSPHNTRISSK